MEIYDSKSFNSKNLSELMFEVIIILSDKTLLINNNSDIFEERIGLNFNDIRQLLLLKKIKFNDDDLWLVLNKLLVNYQNIVRNEYWYKDTEYEMLDKIKWGHKVQQVHYSFEDDLVSEKIFLLISDTHIGNNEMFNSKLLHNLYDYAIKNGALKCFHMGDLFEGFKGFMKNICEINENKVIDFEEEFCRQVNLFINEYPKPSVDEFRTYCLIGNHDETMNNFLKFRGFLNSSDLRKLSIYDPSFYVFPRTSWGANLNGVDFHFNHRLYMSAIVDNLKINKINDIDKSKARFGNLMTDLYDDVLVSGHLHKGIIYTGEDIFCNKDKLYLGVPSTSNVNVGRTVGYLVYMYPEANCMEVSILGSDSNLNIYEIDRIFWSFDKKNKSYCRTL